MNVHGHLATFSHIVSGRIIVRCSFVVARVHACGLFTKYSCSLNSCNSPNNGFACIHSLLRPCALLGIAVSRCAGIADPAESFPLLPSLYIILITLNKYRGITLSQVLKLLERILDAMIRRRVECDFGEEQQGFRKEEEQNVLKQMV